MRRKFFLLFATLDVVVNFLFTTHAVAQEPLSFSDDSIIVETCDDAWQLVGVIEMYTHTKEDVTIRWDITELKNLTPGEIFLIVDPYQYAPYTMGAFANIWSDTTDILFHMFPDTLLPGDTALIQLGVYDTKDSANTYQLLTTILTYPLSSGSSVIDDNEEIMIYPNPFNFSTTLQIPNDIKYTDLIVYNMMGQIVNRMNITNHQTELYRNNLPEGMYIICLIKDQLIKDTLKVVVRD
jgi:hypothetical protein